jgi:DnaK suppressor protein
MRRRDLEAFRKRFVKQRAEYAAVAQQNHLEAFTINDDDRPDEVDLASADIEESIRLQLRNRGMERVRQLDEAIRRIDFGTFGICCSCEEHIEAKRLEANPIATLCVACQEEEEKTAGYSGGLRRAPATQSGASLFHASGK